MEQRKTVAQLGNLFVKFDGDTRGLENATNRAEGSISRFSAQARRGINIAAKYGAAFAAAGAAIAARFTAQQFKAIDAASKLARQLNTTTESIATMQRAGELTGIRDMDMNLERLNRRLSEAIGGTGQATRALDKLGLSARDLQQLPIDDRIREIGRAMMDNVDATEHAAIANDLFGRSGMQMLEVLRDADNQLDNAARQADAFGLAVSDVDAAAIERANDAMSSINAVLEGVWRRIAVQVAPIVEHLATRFQDVALESRGFESTILDVMDKARKAVGHVADGIQGLRVAFKGVEVAGRGMQAVMLSVADVTNKAFTTMLQGIMDRVRSLIEAFNRIPKVDISTDGLNTLSDGLDKSRENIGRWAEEARESTKQAAQEFHELAMQEMPSERIAQFFEDATEASRKASEDILERRRQMFGELPGMEEAQQEELEKIREHAANKLEQLRESLLDEREAEKEHHAQRMELLEDALDHELMSLDEINALKEREEQRHRDTMQRITEKGAKDAADASIREAERQAREEQRTRDKMHDGMNSTLSAMAKDNKAFGAAQAVINTWRGVSETMATYPWPVAAAMAASHLAAGMQAVRSIKSAPEKGSGASGGGSIPSSGGGAQTASGASGGGGNRGTAVYNIHGDVFDRETTLRVARQISELERDGYDVMVPAT